MDTARIAALLKPFLAGTPPPPERLLFDISMYVDMLLRWNARINLTAIRDPEDIVSRHFGESLFAARHLFPESIAGHRNDGSGRVESEGGRAALQGPVSGAETKGALAPVPEAAEQRQSAADGASRGTATPLAPAAEQRKKIRLADIGSGAGFPGVPIKLWAPDIHVTLIESNHKKATFLRELARTLTLTDIDVQNTRAESLPEASFDVVTMRAVERFESILPIAAGLVAPGGSLALLIGMAQVPPAQSLLPSFEFQDLASVPLSGSRSLLVGIKR